MLFFYFYYLSAQNIKRKSLGMEFDFDSKLKLES